MTRTMLVVGFVVSTSAAACIWNDECVGGAMRIGEHCVLSTATDGSATDAGRDDAPPVVDAGCGGLDQCGEQCVDMASDPDHCGGCGNRCGWACGSGSCVEVQDVEAGAFSTCVLLSDGRAACWGDNRFGQLGDGTIETRTAPVLVAGLSGASDVAVGGLHVCFVRGAGAVECLGSNASGQLGDGTMRNSNILVRAGSLTAMDVATGLFHTCARDAVSAALCWGENADGQLGDGTMTARPDPTRVMGLASVDEVALGSTHTCVREAGGSVQCWGSNTMGQLGTGGTTTTPVTMPVAVPAISGAVAIDAGSDATCVLTTAMTVMCWGDNRAGQLGDGNGGHDGDFSAMPVQVSGIIDAIEISVGEQHACVVHATGAVSCWGLNRNGQVGNGSIDNQTMPVAVPGLTDAVEVSAGTDHTCARRSGGEVVCWGDNAYGQLGDGTMEDRSTPVPVRTR